VRIRTNILCPQSSYKTVYIARNTTARQLIRLIINSSETDEKPEDFILREASADFTGISWTVYVFPSSDIWKTNL